MTFSLILCSLDRFESVKACLDSLFHQTFDDFEIILVDQSDDSYPFDETTLSRIGYYQIEQKGLSHARNFGISKARGDYICLIDDDAIYDENYLLFLADKIKKRRCSVVGGRMVDPESGRSKFSYSQIKITWSNALRYLSSPSMAIRKDILQSHPFDENLGVGAKYGCGEETDIVFYCLHKKEEIYCYSEPVVFHPIGNKSSSQRVYSYSVGYGALLFKTKKRYSHFWSKFYMIKTCFGNALKLCVALLTFNAKGKEMAKARLRGVSFGFKAAKEDYN